MMATTTPTQSKLLQYLPAIYQQDPFLGEYMLAFEKILLGREDGVQFPETGAVFPQRGLEEIIDQLAVYFDPLKTPSEFLPWLANWTAFTLRADLPLDKQREFTANIIQFYLWRGTKRNLQKLLAIFTIGLPEILESSGAELQVGVHSTVGVDTYIGGGPPHYFRVNIVLPRMQEGTRDRQLQIARALIDLEKPAHTVYDLIPISPTMQVGIYSTVGVDTLLGTPEED